MKLDLTKAGGIDEEDVRALLASKDDSVARQLRVSIAGEAYLSDDVGAEKLDGVLFRFETWDAGNSYCGAEAAADEGWVNSVLFDLKENWPDPKADYIDW